MSDRRTLGNRYRLVSKLGEGGMAEVYLATDLLLNRAVAVKILHARFAGDREFVERFRREAQAAASLSHPNVVNIYDVGEDEDTHYIVLEYVKGRNLKDILRSYGPLPIRQATFVARAVAAALAAAHRQNLIHRDVKPHNILITDEGRVKVTDFGIARAASAATLTHTGTMLGSVHYFSPEQARGQPAGPQSDVYSLGVVLYEMLTGRVPFTSDTPVGVALKHLQEDPVPPSRYRRRLPERLEAIVLRAMAKDPDERYASPADMLADLRAFSREYQPAEEEFLLEEDEGSEWDEGETPVTAAAATEPDGTPPAAGSGRARRLYRGRAAADDERTALWQTSGPTDENDGEPEEPTRIVSPRSVTATALGEGEGSEGEDGEGERTPRGRRGRWVWAAVALVLVYVGISQGAPAVINWIFPPDVVVPDVVGLHLDVARERLREAGLELTLERRVHHPEVPEFHIIAQSPDPHRTVKMRRAIHVTMSLGPDRVPTPDVLGLPEREARLLITQEGFVLGAVHEEFRTDADPHTVIDQWPAPGEVWERGQPVDLWIARPSEARPRVILPDLRGMSLTEVRTQLQALGLMEGNLWPEPAARVPPGRVIDQNPPPGHETEMGSPVDLVYSASAPVDPPETGPGSSAPTPAPAAPALPPEPQRHRADVSVYVPDGPPQEVVIVVIDDFGAREVYRHTVAGGTRFDYLVEARGARARVQVYLGGAMVKDTRLDEGTPATNGAGSGGAMGGSAWGTPS